MKLEDYVEDEELEDDWIEEDINPDFKFEYAHESTTESNSQFRKIMPIFE